MQKTATASIWTIGGKLLARVLDFLTLLLLARLLSPEDFGLVAIATSILVIVEAILDLPLTQALVRQPAISEAMFKTALTLSTMRGALIIVVMLAMAWPLAMFYSDDRLLSLVAVLSIAPAARSISSPRMVLFMQKFDFRREFALDVFAKASTLVFAASISLATGSYWGLAIGAVAGPLAATCLSYIFAPMRPAFSLSEWRTFQDMVGWNSVAQILNSINWQLDRLLLPRFTSLSAFGAFSVADSLAGIPHQTFVGPLMRPLMAAFSSVEDHGKLSRAYLKATNAITLVAAPVLVVLALLSEPIVRIVVGNKWSFASPIFEMLCLVSLLSLPSTIMPALAMVLDKTRYVALRMFVEFIVRAPVTVLAIAFFGLNGAIVARFTAVIVAYGTSLIITRKLIGVSIMAQLAAFIRPMVPLIPMVAFLLAVEPTLVQMPTGMQLFISLAFCAGAAMGIFWLGALLLWQAIGRPDGLEAIIVQKLLSGRRVLSVNRST